MSTRPPFARLVVVCATSALAFTAPSASAERVPPSVAARRFVADTAPLARASARFETTALSWIGNPTITQAAATSAAKPLVRALDGLVATLGHQPWPTSVRSRVGALERTSAHLVKDLKALRHADLAKTATWEGPLLADQVAMTAAVNAVRRGLGLRALNN